MTTPSDADLTTTIYAVTVDPDRYDDLVTSWVEKLSAAVAQQGADATPTGDELDEHVQQATQILAMLASSQANDLAAQSSMDETKPELRVDKKGVVQSLNSAAQKTYEINSQSSLVDLPFDTEAQRTLSALVNRLVVSDDNSQANPLIRARRSDNGQVVFIALSGDPADKARVVMHTTDVVWTDRLTKLLKESFDLTAAETDVGRLLVEGLSIAEIAESRNKSIATVRVQTRELFAKTSTSGQREFIRIAIGLAAMYKDEPTQNKSSATALQAGVYPRAEHKHRLLLPDGRHMEYADFGKPNGRPCLYIHDALFGPILPASLVELLTQKNLRIISPARQHWGRTGAYPDKSYAYDQHAQDVRYLCDQLKLSEVTLIARTLGTVYAYAILQADPARYTGLFGIAPALPFGSAADIAKMAPHQRFLTVTVQRSKAYLKFVSMAGEAVHNRYGPERFLRMIYRSSPQDLKVIEDPAALAIMKTSLLDSAPNLVSPFYAEFKDRVPKTWTTNVNMPVPFHIIVGDHDPSARMRRVVRMQKAGVAIEVHTVKQAGELFIYSHPEQVALALDDLLTSTTSNSLLAR